MRARRHLGESGHGLPESAGLTSKATKATAAWWRAELDDAMRLLTRLARSDHPRYATRAVRVPTRTPRVRTSSSRSEAPPWSALQSARPGAAASWTFSSLRGSRTREIDGTGAAAILQRSLKEVCAQ